MANELILICHKPEISIWEKPEILILRQQTIILIVIRN